MMSNNNRIGMFAAAASLGCCYYLAVRCRSQKAQLLVVPPGSEDLGNNSNNYDKDEPNLYDVIVVGAGPAGSTVSYFLGEGNNCRTAISQQQRQRRPLKILLLERHAFPRVKYCGDAWCHQALEIMEEMAWTRDPDSGKLKSSVLDELHTQQLCHRVQRGGFVSPFGHECINSGGDETYGSVAKVRTYAIKRVIADEYLARAAAQQPGVELLEQANVDVAKVCFDENDKHWTVPIKMEKSNHSATNDIVTVKGRVLVAADGATSYLARHLGLVNTDADVVCSHRYATKSSTNNFTSDGVMFYNRSVLPGYSALFRHYNGDVYLGTYILPGGKAASRSIAPFEQELVNRHPYVRKAFGGAGRGQEDSNNNNVNIYDNTTWRVDPTQGETGKMKTAPIRCGGESMAYGDHILLLGDSAGQTDPLTGEGIHTAMVAAKLAATTIHEMFDANNFSQQATRVYHNRWMQAFGNDFAWSALGAKLIYYFPILLDATCAYGRDYGGQAFLDEFGLIMTGVKPKSDFLQWPLAVPISFYLIREFVHQYILRRPPLIPQDIGQAVVDKHYESSLLAQKKTKRLSIDDAHI